MFGITVQQVLAVAHKLVDEGFAAAGYTLVAPHVPSALPVCIAFAPHCSLAQSLHWHRFVNLDDAWSAPMRGRGGKLEGDRQRFPSGIKWLAQQLHAMGLKLGL